MSRGEGSSLFLLAFQKKLESIFICLFVLFLLRVGQGSHRSEWEERASWTPYKAPLLSWPRHSLGSLQPGELTFPLLPPVEEC